MRKGLKSLSALLTAAALFAGTALTAVAAEETRIEIQGSENVQGSFDNSITLTNVTEGKTIGGYLPFYTSEEGPVTITFEGDGLSAQWVGYYPEASIEGDEFIWGDIEEEVAFEVKKYSHFDSDEVLDENEVVPEDMVVYKSGNYATISEPGYYMVWGAPEAMEGVSLIILIGEPPVAGTKPTAPVEQPEQPAGPQSAAPTASSVLVDGEVTAFDAYNIGGNNFFKLRDLAAAVNGSAKNFEVTWDPELNAINLLTEQAYTSVGGELEVAVSPTTQEALPTTSKIYLDGEEIVLTAYNIGGNNYFKLRDIAKAMDIGITWDGDTSTIGIDTSISYTEE